MVNGLLVLGSCYLPIDHPSSQWSSILNLVGNKSHWYFPTALHQHPASLQTTTGASGSHQEPSHVLHCHEQDWISPPPALIESFTKVQERVLNENGCFYLRLAHLRDQSRCCCRQRQVCDQSCGSADCWVPVCLQTWWTAHPQLDMMTGFLMMMVASEKTRQNKIL